MTQDPKWKRFEKLVAKIQQDLSPDAIVTHNEKILGKDSGTLRQIDVLVRKKVGQYELLIAMSCKDHKEPVDINDLGSFITDVTDIRANHGAMVAANGFTEGAKTLAKTKGINLYRLIDAEQHDWHTELSLPTLCEETYLYGFQLIFTGSNPFGFSLEDQQNFGDVQLYNEKHQPIGTIDDLLVQQWNARELPAEEGTHVVTLGNGPVYKIYEGNYCRISVDVNIFVNKRFYFGWWNVDQMSGFADEITGVLTTRGFKMRPITPEIIKTSWELVDPEALAIQPIINIQTFALKFRAAPFRNLI